VPGFVFFEESGVIFLILLKKASVYRVNQLEVDLYCAVSVALLLKVLVKQ
jgi:hypothetical protein